jgi:hypothetical protein
MTAIITKNGASAHRSTPKFTEAAEQFALFLSESRSGASHSEWADPTLSKEIYIPASISSRLQIKYIYPPIYPLANFK